MATVGGAGKDGRSQWEHRVETLATVLLAAAALATAWSTFQAGRWRGDQAAATGKSTAARIESSRASTRAGQLTQIDIATFIQWSNAQLAGNGKLAEYYRRRFRPEFRPAFQAWLATRPLENPKAPTSPFVMTQYHVAESESADRLARSADQSSAAAAAANRHADDYLLTVVLFASALFFAGISTKVRPLRQRQVLLALGYAIFLAGIVWLGTSPVTFSV